MARKKNKSGSKDEGSPAWLVTFTDLMTLMLTFFVLLVSMATMDERRRLIVLGSIIGTFGMGDAGIDPRTTRNRRTTIEPGPMEDIESLETLKDTLWEDLQDDINFHSNKFVEILSINDRVLFEPGQNTLSDTGRDILDRILPLLFQIDHPLLLAGHTSTIREEMQEEFLVDMMQEKPDVSWKLSFFRILSIYRYLISRGMDTESLRMEAFGRFKPRYTDNTATGRRKNRRVEIILDKRNKAWIDKWKELKEQREERETQYRYKDFIFDITTPGPGNNQ